MNEHLVLVFVITVTYAPSAAASDARSEAAGDVATSSRPSDNADEAAPPAPEGLVGRLKFALCESLNRGNAARLKHPRAHQQTLL